MPGLGSVSICRLLIKAPGRGERVVQPKEQMFDLTFTFYKINRCIYLFVVAVSSSQYTEPKCRTNRVVSRLKPEAQVNHI